MGAVIRGGISQTAQRAATTSGDVVMFEALSGGEGGGTQGQEGQRRFGYNAYWMTSQTFQSTNGSTEDTPVNT